ncbi:NAD(P)-dependent oxidoreductase [Salipiger sp. PrR007]|uniref:NAD-dependent epimerase/dehydratase family protein n=1 Tax=Salipiger sp. PrR007 TaxID=2706884 RepID=UPI0013BB6D79|nr:NAD(P)-dependent oxidoreductase [Salipiger sp. PrR007]NDW33414.1 NAD(P)-dependent oxidoreductase [Salipiger sp. PrR007]
MNDTPAFPPRILVTGAAGSLGGQVARHLAQALSEGRIAALRLVDIRPVTVDLAGTPERLEMSLQTREAAFRVAEGMDAIIHLAGIPVEDEWEALIPANIAATAHLFDAAMAHGVDRLLFASSNHAIGMYPVMQRLDHATPPLADSRYGVTKAFGEQLAALCSARTPLRSFCMRIGSCFEVVSERRQLSTFQSFADLLRLVDVGLTADYRHEIVYGLSDIPDGYWDNANAFRLGYAPQDHPQDFAPAKLPSRRYAHQGGEFAERPFSPPKS